MSGMPREIAEKIRAIGHEMNPAIAVEMKAAYAPHIAAPTGVTVSRDLAYGDDRRQRLDVYRAGAAFGLPVVLYLPGGGFIGGDKNLDGTFMGNVGAYFARHGMLGVVANYRLAPAHPFPAGAEDVGRAIAWLRENAAAHGGDPARIFLYGHSAGATHAATYLFHHGAHATVVGAILMSGLYKVLKPHATPNVTAYFGDDEEQLAERSPVTHAHRSAVPLLLMVAELDPLFFPLQTLELAAAVCDGAGPAPQVAWVRGHNHFSTAYSVGSEDDAVGARVRRFIAG